MNLAERLRNVFNKKRGNIPKPDITELPLKLNKLARVEAKIADYEASFTDGCAPIIPSFGTLTEDEQEAIINRFAVGKGVLPVGCRAMVYRTNLIWDRDKKSPLFLFKIGDYGIQIDNDNFGAIWES